MKQISKSVLSMSVAYAKKNSSLISSIKYILQLACDAQKKCFTYQIQIYKLTVLWRCFRSRNLLVNFLNKRIIILSKSWFLTNFIDVLILLPSLLTNLLFYASLKTTVEPLLVNLISRDPKKVKILIASTWSLCISVNCSWIWLILTN